MRAVRLSDEAKADLRSIADYSNRRWGRERTAAYMGRIRQVILNLQVGRSRGRSRDDLAAGLRSIRVGRHILIFRVSDEAVGVRRVLHERMNLSVKEVAVL